MQRSTSPASITRAQPTVLEALPLALRLERLGGGNETDVYRTADQRFVIKLKRFGGGSVSMARAQARLLRGFAEHFAACLGAEYSLPSTFVVARDHLGDAQVVTIQPFLKDARPLYTINYLALPPAQRQHIMAQLHVIIERAQACYRATGLVPDLYGISSVSPVELARLRAAYMAPIHLWHFLITRTLLRSHNLLLTPAPEHRVVLVDYDLVMLHKPHLVRRIYFAFRALLFRRDLALIRRHRAA